MWDSLSKNCFRSTASILKSSCWYSRRRICVGFLDFQIICRSVDHFQMPTDVEDKNNTQSSGNCCSSTPNSKRPIDSNTTHTHKIQTNILRLNTLETSAQMCIDERPDRKKNRMAPSPKSSFLRTPNFCTEHKTTKIKTNRIWVGNMREKTWEHHLQTNSPRLTLRPRSSAFRSRIS